MPDIKDLLGNKEEQPTTPLEEGGTPEEGNPLEKMDEISKKTPDNKKESGKKLDEETVKEMLMTGDNSDGMFEPEEKEPEEGEPEIHEDVDEDAKVSIKGTATPKGKYEKGFIEDMMKHPEKYTVQTPYGEMTIAEAMRKGYNPITKTFDKEKDFDNIKDKYLSRLNDADEEALSRISDPSAAQIAPADAEKYGLAADSPMIRQPEVGSGMPMAPTAGAAPMPAGPEAMQAAPMPQEQMAPPQAGGMPPQAGGQDLAALLGGGM